MGSNPIRVTEGRERGPLDFLVRGRQLLKLERRVRIPYGSLGCSVVGTRDVRDIESAAQFRTPEFSAVHRGMKKIDWKHVQQLYDSGYTYRQLAAEGYASHRTIALAVRRGDLVTRTGVEASQKFRDSGKKLPPWSAERRAAHGKRMSEIFYERPELHPNNKVANNRVKMSYPERLAHCFFADNGFQFEHQKRIGRYWSDFYLPDSNLVVEIDGAYWHKDDTARDDFIRGQGYQIIRFKAKNIIAQLNLHFDLEYLISKEEAQARLLDAVAVPRLCGCGKNLAPKTIRCLLCSNRNLGRLRIENEGNDARLDSFRAEIKAGGNFSSFGRKVGCTANNIRNWLRKRGLRCEYDYHTRLMVIS